MPVTTMPSVASAARPIPVGEHAADGRQDHQTERQGRQLDARLDRVLPLRALEVEHQQEQHAIAGDAIEQRREVAHQEQPVAQQRQVDERRPDSSFDRPQHGHQDHEQQQPADDPPGAPAVQAAEGERGHQAQQGDEVDGRTEPVDGRRLLTLHLLHQHQHAQRRPR